jgi:carboxyl-terminal processing protease
MYLDVSPNAPAPAMNRAGLGFAKNSPEAFDVVGVRPGSPAALTGIEAGDRIVKVNGEDVEQLAYFDLYNLVTGPRGAQIHLTIEHRGSERDVVLVLK